jgi:hypothetical protein
MNSSTLSELYPVNDSDQPVKLKVEIGYRHQANSKVMINGKQIPGPELDGSFSGSFVTLLGNNRDLNNKDLVMTTMVMSVPDEPDKMSVNVMLTGGVGIFNETLESNEAADEGVVAFGMDIRFYK